MKNSPFWRAMFNAWELAFDIPLPNSWRPEPANHSVSAAETGDGMILYALPVWGALGGVAALVLAQMLHAWVPATGAAIVFGLFWVWLGERRTGSRGLALAASVGEGLLAGENWRAATAGRKNAIRQLAGPYANLLVVGMLALKFFAYFQCFRTGHPGFAGAVLVLALGAEASLAALPEAVHMLPGPRTTSISILLALSGFFLLFNLISLPLPTLIALGGAAALTGLLAGERIRGQGQIDPDDMTLAGYGVELWALAVVLLLAA